MKRNDRTAPDAKFWCDTIEFDLDLYKVIPEARDILQPVANVLVTTYGSVSNERLNHPAVWNNEGGYVAYFGLSPGHPHKPDHYYAGPADQGWVEATFEEAIRDAWCHHMIMLFMRRYPIWNTCTLMEEFQTLLYHVRKWKEDERAAAKAIRKVTKTLKAAVSDFDLLIGNYHNIQIAAA